MPAWTFHVWCVISVLLGLTWCLFGYRLFRIVLAISGAVILGFTGLLTVWVVSGSLLLAVASAVLGAALGGVIFYALYWVFVFLLGALAGFGGVSLIALACGRESADTGVMLVAAVAAIVLGVLALIYRRGVLTVITSLEGAFSAVLHTHALATGPRLLMTLQEDAFWKIHQEMLRVMGNNLPVVVGACLLLATVGIIVQFRTTAKTAQRVSRKPGKRRTRL